MNEVHITGYQPGALGKILELQGRFYRRQFGLDVSFETDMATKLIRFLNDFQEGRDGLWLAILGDDILGSIVVDAQANDTMLRWFILAPQARGSGLGKRLLGKALSFCWELGYSRVKLETNPQLAAAVHLYRQTGFRLVREEEIFRWGQNLVMQTFECSSPYLQPERTQEVTCHAS